MIHEEIKKYVGAITWDVNGMINLISKAKIFKPRGFLDGQRGSITYDQDMITRHLYYRGKMKQDLIDTISSLYPKSHHKMMPYTVRMVTKYINRSANIYINAPERTLSLNGNTLSPDDNNVFLFNDFVKQSKYDRYWKQQNRYSRLFRTTFGRVLFDNKTGFPHWRIFPPYCVERIPNPDNPSDIDSDYCVVLRLSSIDGFYSDNISVKNNRFEVWINEGFGGVSSIWARHYFDGEKFVDDNDNKLDFLPITAIYDEEPDEPFINSGDDMLDAARSMNVLFTDAKFISQYQAHSQLVHKTDNPKGDSQLAVGADKVTLIPTSDDLSVVDYNPKISDIMSMGKDMIYIFAIMNNMSPNQFRVDRQSLTGVALKVENLDLMEDRQDKLTLFEDYEREHFDKTVKMYNIYGDSLFSSGIDMRWTPGDPDIISDDEANMRIWQQEKREGVSDNTQWVMEKHNISKEDAVSFLEEIGNRKVVSLKDVNIFNDFSKKESDTNE